MPELAGCGNRHADLRCRGYRTHKHPSSEFVEVVYFVDHQNNRLAASSEHICYFGIGIYKALTDISDKDNDICGINGDLRLVSHLGENDILALRLNTAGIDQCKICDSASSTSA